MLAIWQSAQWKEKSLLLRGFNHRDHKQPLKYRHCACQQPFVHSMQCLLVFKGQGLENGKRIVCMQAYHLPLTRQLQGGMVLGGGGVGQAVMIRVDGWMWRAYSSSSCADKHQAPKSTPATLMCYRDLYEWREPVRPNTRPSG